MRSRRVVVCGLAVAIAAMGPATVAVSAASPGSGSVETTTIELTPQPVIDGMGYVPEGMPDLGGDVSVEDGSASGWVVGSVFDTDAGQFATARWPSGGGALEVLSEGKSFPMGVRDDGTAVGERDELPIIWGVDGSETMLDTAGATGARAFSINSSGWWWGIDSTWGLTEDGSPSLGRDRIRRGLGCPTSVVDSTPHMT